jgi:hypothetical protein
MRWFTTFDYKEAIINSGYNAQMVLSEKLGDKNSEVKCMNKSIRNEDSEYRTSRF